MISTKRIILIVFISLIVILLCIVLLYIFLRPSSSTPKTSSTAYYPRFIWENDTLVRMDPSHLNSDWEFSPGASIDMFDNGDPTHGSVVYGSNSELVQIKNNQLYMYVEPKAPSSGFRKAPRIHCKTLFNDGLFIIDVEHIPVGPGVWPAFWLNGNVTGGQRWACKGEIDIIEGVTDHSTNDNIGKSTKNLSTLHTSIVDGEDCTQDGVPGITHNSCSASDKSDWTTCGCSGKEICPTAGCSVEFPDANSFGIDFNNNKGGVYACELLRGQVTIWFWPRNSTMPDFNDPDPTTWITSNPKNTVRFKSCPKHFKDLALIINTTLCGDWAGRVFNPAVDMEKSKSDCVGYMNDKSVELSEAYWVINSLKTFQKKKIK